ncbi:L-lactate dehydrogenase [Pasteurellaceae bacterium 20609_3]|uniref:lactate/malate family dehydrogenase n=1 Tax=Spirabiliibacterium mucosae TaxID=28156 RepID=UPI001AAD400D|nr:L-lactate dehydrogenase [Spirabiliibacterium mucosae]MBE2898533.1 L-lactate dehydrogenase [Spirabiliibacterium mucosae]
MKISVIGAGAVGVEICNFVLNLGECSELVLVDLNRERCQGEQIDFSHMSALTFAKNTHVVSGDYADTAGSDIIVITAGAQIKVGQDRLDIAQINAKIGVEIAQELEKYSPEAILIVVTNPCDIVTHFITCNTAYPRDRVISSGCVIDSARLMKLVADKVQIDPKNIFGFIIGEHGANSILPWSLMNIAGQKVEDFCRNNGYPLIDPIEQLNEVKQEGLRVFAMKLNTNHGIAASVFRIIRAITINEHSMLPVGTTLDGEYGIHNVALNVPMIVARNGIEKIPTYTFTAQEMQELQHCAQNLRKVAESVAEQTGLKADL